MNNDEKISEIYQTLIHAEPTAAIDQAILAEAREAVRVKPLTEKIAPYRKPLAAAASVLVVLGVTLVFMNDGGQQQALRDAAGAKAERSAAPRPAHEAIPAPSSVTDSLDEEEAVFLEPLVESSAISSAESDASAADTMTSALEKEATTDAAGNAPETEPETALAAEQPSATPNDMPALSRTTRQQTDISFTQLVIDLQGALTANNYEEVQRLMGIYETQFPDDKLPASLEQKVKRYLAQ